MVLATTILIGIGLTPIVEQRVYSVHEDTGMMKKTPLPNRVPIATSGNNIYIVWWDNKTGNNDEVMFKASTDGGKTFGDKINLSNTTKADSQDAQIDTFGDNDSNVIVTWWERNATSNEPASLLRELVQIVAKHLDLY
jgi:hypothetical protein